MVAGAMAGIAASMVTGMALAITPEVPLAWLTGVPQAVTRTTRTAAAVAPRGEGNLRRMFDLWGWVEDGGDTSETGWVRHVAGCVLCACLARAGEVTTQGWTPWRDQRCGSRPGLPQA